MFLLDSLLIDGIRFVLDKVATAADAELNDDTALREQLLAAQMRLELGELSQKAFDALETDILARLREIRQRQRGADADAISPDDMKVVGVEATFEGDEH
jgi:Gas vesicle protein G